MTAPSTSFDDYLKLELRAARLRAQILLADIDAIGLAFSSGLITAEQAIAHLEACDVFRVVGSPERSA